MTRYEVTNVHDKQNIKAHSLRGAIDIAKANCFPDAKHYGVWHINRIKDSFMPVYIAIAHDTSYKNGETKPTIKVTTKHLSNYERTVINAVWLEEQNGN